VIEIPPKLQKLLTELQPMLEPVIWFDSGILVKPKRNLQLSKRLDLHMELQTNNDIKYLVTSDSYLITKETLVAYHLEKLKILFNTRQAEIKESMMFLVAAGMPVDCIQAKTGSSRATIYRYLK
jgi:hypothetical protein